MASGRRRLARLRRLVRRMRARRSSSFCLKRALQQVSASECDGTKHPTNDDATNAELQARNAEANPGAVLQEAQGFRPELAAMDLHSSMLGSLFRAGRWDLCSKPHVEPSDGCTQASNVHAAPPGNSGCTSTELCPGEVRSPPVADVDTKEGALGAARALASSEPPLFARGSELDIKEGLSDPDIPTSRREQSEVVSVVDPPSLGPTEAAAHHQPSPLFAGAAEASAKQPLPIPNPTTERTPVPRAVALQVAQRPALAPLVEPEPKAFAPPVGHRPMVTPPLPSHQSLTVPPVSSTLPAPVGAPCAASTVGGSAIDWNWNVWFAPHLQRGPQRQFSSSPAVAPFQDRPGPFWRPPGLGTRPPHPIETQRVYVLDALNILRHRNVEEWTSQALNLGQLLSAGVYYRSKGHQVFAFLPRACQIGPCESFQLMAALGPDCLVTTPAGISDDKFMLSYALDSHERGLHVRIVTNDLFRDHCVNRVWAEMITVKFAFAAGCFIPESANK